MIVPLCPTRTITITHPHSPFSMGASFPLVPRHSESTRGTQPGTWTHRPPSPAVDSLATLDAGLGVGAEATIEAGTAAIVLECSLALAFASPRVSFLCFLSFFFVFFSDFRCALLPSLAVLSTRLAPAPVPSITRYPSLLPGFLPRPRAKATPSITRPWTVTNRA